jgi:hypothetical protein
MSFKTQRILGALFFIVIFLLFSTTISTEGKNNNELEKLKSIKDAYPNASHYYRGVVAIDANNGGSDELYCDFGSNGLWVYHGSWVKLNAGNPERIIGFEEGSTEYLLCDFGASGLWYWYYNGSWSGQFVKITAADPIDIIFVSDWDGDGDDEVFLDFDTNGLWVYDKGAATILSKLHATSPEMSGSLRSDLWTAGHDEVAFDFDTEGLWTVYTASDTIYWNKINASSPSFDSVSANVENSNANEELIIDFGSTGIWAYDGSTWHKLSSNNPVDMVQVYFGGGADYELLVQFIPAVSNGLWMWNYSGYPGTWTRLSISNSDSDSGFCEPFDPDEDGWEEAAVDFMGDGLWIYDHGAATKWTKINTSNPSFMIAADISAGSFKSDLIVDFGTSGLWQYVGTSSTWIQLTTFSPDGVN